MSNNLPAEYLICLNCPGAHCPVELVDEGRELRIVESGESNRFFEVHKEHDVRMDKNAPVEFGELAMKALINE